MWSFINKRMKMFESATLSDKNKVYSYSYFRELVKKKGNSLQLKLPQHSKCAVLCDSGINTVLAIFSCWYARLIPIPMSKHYGEQHCTAILELTEPDCIITDSGLNESNCLIYRIDLDEFIGCASEIKSENELYNVALIMCTSGTTGKPKGAMITESGLKSNVIAISKYFDISHKDTILIARPLYHCAVITGELLISLYFGLNICFCDEKYNPSNIIKLCGEFNITVLCGTPTLFRQISMLSMRLECNLKLRIIVLSGECLRKEIATQIRNVFPKSNIYHVYGLTEASPRVTYLPPVKFDTLPESAGIPIYKTQIKIVDSESLLALPSNTHGLVLIKSSSLMKGYYRDKKRTAKVLKNGWLNTGDIGYIDNDGYLTILSRADDMIIKAGMNIYPKEIEAAIEILPEIADSSVYGIKTTIGQEIAIDVVVAEGYKNIDAKRLLSAFVKVLPAYQIPSQINIVDKLERNASGKIVKKNK